MRLALVKGQQQVLTAWQTAPPPEQKQRRETQMMNERDLASIQWAEYLT